MIVEEKDMRPPVLVLCGPTASGKTSLAVRVAKHLPIEIISADSRQVYRYMDVGTAKPLPEELAAAPHHLIDVANPDENFTASDFSQLGRRALYAIRERGRLPVIVGGTGLYIHALLHGLVDAPGADSGLRATLLQEEEKCEGILFARLQSLDPVLARRLPPNDLVRIVRGLEVHALSGRCLSDIQAEHASRKSPFRVITFGLTMPRDDLYRRIDQRVCQMIKDGLVQEVEGLLNKGYSPDSKSMRTIGYREIVQYISGNLSLEEAVSLIQRDSRRYAKRQLTWFNKVKSIIWLDSSGEFAKVLKLIESFFYAT